MKKILFALILCLSLIGLFPSAVQADGIIIPPPCPQDRCPPPPPCPWPDCPPIPPRPIAQLVIRYHHVTVSIQDQLAVTHVDQVFYNPNAYAIEGTYIFPLPQDAAVSNFTLWIDGKPVQGQVLSAEEARKIYEETTRSLRDPALLEYEGRGVVKASIFPIPSKGERRIELEYTQALTAQNGLVRYTYPLRTEQYSALPLEDASIQVDIRDKQAIRAVYSPTHAIATNKQDPNHVTAGYEAKNVRPDADFDLYYSLGESEAFHLFSYRDPADTTDPDGFFLLLLAPKPEVSPQPVAKDVLLVLDRSGSMDGNDKFQQAQAALRFILQKLNPTDRFYLETFSTGVERYADGLRPADEANEAIDWVNRLSASGSTDINRALLEAASVTDKERPTYLIFLTDGQPTEGVVSVPDIIKNFDLATTANLRVFPFGVGNDVNTVLLDTLSQEHHGQSSYVRPGQPLDEALSGFYERISAPVLTDLKLDFSSLATYDIYPNPLPDLFQGGQVIVVGRYRVGGTFDVTLQGQVNGNTQTLHFPSQVFDQDSRGALGNLDSLPRLWATRKIGYLLNQIRLNGPDKETIQQIVSLSVRYGIVTEYTSYLVTESSPLGQQSQEQIAQNAYSQAQAAPPAATGGGAVDRASQEGAMKSAEVAPSAPSGMGGGQNSDGSGTAIRIVGSRTFLYKDSAWTDTAYDPQTMASGMQKIAFLSDDYFKLLAARPDLASALALGDQVTIVVDGAAYQVGPEGSSTGPAALPPTAPAPKNTPVIVATAPVQKTILPQPSATPVQSARVSTPAPTQRASTPAPSGGSRACFAGLMPLALVVLVILLKRHL